MTLRMLDSVITRAGLAGCLLAGWAQVSFSQTGDPLTLEVRAAKERYVLGESVALTFRLLNRSSSSVTLDSAPDVQNGRLDVLIAFEGGDFKSYLGPDWGLRDAVSREPFRLAPGQSFETQASILFHHVMPVGHLSPLYANQIRQEQILDEYALSAGGTYRIKAALSGTRDRNQLESPPLTLSVDEPYGADLEVWNVLKTDGDFGYFLQTGSPRKPRAAAKTEHIVRTLENLSQLWPTSRHIGSIRTALSKHQARLAATGAAVNTR